VFRDLLIMFLDFRSCDSEKIDAVSRQINDQTPISVFAVILGDFNLFTPREANSEGFGLIANGPLRLAIRAAVLLQAPGFRDVDIGKPEL